MLHKNLTHGLTALLLLGSVCAHAQTLEEPQWLQSPAQTAPLEQKLTSVPSAASVKKTTPQTEAVSKPITLSDPQQWAARRGEPKAAGHALPGLRRSAQAPALTDLAGQWISQYPMYDSQLWGGATATFTVTGTNTVTIRNFWRVNMSVTATYDAAAGTLTIPVQKVTTRTDGTTVTVAPLNTTNGYPIRTQPLVCKVMEDGSILYDQAWGIFYDRDDPNGGDDPGYYKDDYANIYTYLSYERGTSTMSHVNVTNNDTLTYPIIATQTGANVLQIKNFLGYGQNVDLLLNRDNTYTVRTQVGCVEGYTPYYTRGDIVMGENGPASWNETFSFPANASDPKTINFGNMSLFYSRSYWIGLIENARINLNAAPAFPPAFTAWEGEGTKASPYLIKTYNDLVQLQERVNSDTNYDYYYYQENTATGGTDTIYYARPFLGKYFRLMADLDMTGYDFTPIGVNGRQYFAADFDGNSHTIKGLNIYGGQGYAALFGYVDQAAKLHDLTLDGFTVSTSSIYAGTLASRCEGEIVNCHVKNSSVSVANGYQGAGALTGFCYEISNSTVTDCQVYAGDGYGGGITGQLFGDMVNCHVSGTTISGMIYNAGTRPPYGGLAASSNSAITDCSFNGVIEIPYAYYPATIGGLVGIISGAGRTTGITRCVAAGRFLGSMGSYSSQNYIGGLGGQLACDVTDSYASGEVRASGSVVAGGLSGLTQYVTNVTTDAVSIPKFTRSYSSVWLNIGTPTYTPSNTTCMELFGSSDPAHQPVVTNCYFNSDITNFGSTNYAATTAQLTSAAGPQGFSDGAWTLAANTYPRLTAQLTRPVSDLSGSAILYTAKAPRSRVTENLQLNPLGSTEFGFMVNGQFTKQGHYATIEGNTLKINNQLLFGNDTIQVRCGAGVEQYIMLIAPTPWQGTGTEADPWLITNKADMIALGKMTSESRISFPNTYYKMTADIDMEYTDEFEGVSYTNTTGRYLFHGTFDGDGHTFHNLKIGRIVWTVKPEDDPTGRGTVNTTASRGTYCGLFGEIANDGVVKNVNIAADCRYEGFATFGSIAGNNYGLIQNCRNYADITGQSSWIGGIAGQIQKGGQMADCFNAGNVTSGYRNAGGITSQTQGLIVNCTNTGTVRVISLYQAAGRGTIMYAGGIAGGMNGGSIRNCFNGGYVFALEGYAGGITGNAPSAINSANFPNELIGNINVGVADSEMAQRVGGIAGGTGTTGTVENNYYDAQLTPQGAMESQDHAGVTGLTTAAMTAGTALQGLTTTDWNFAANAYPAPAAYLAEPTVTAARRSYVVFGEGQNRQRVESEATLSTYEGLTWAMASNNGFTIANGKLMIPTDSKTVINDTVTGTIGKFIRIIPVRYIPGAPWSGAGSETDPYLISTVDEWNSIAALIKQTGATYENTWFKVVNDIDFNNTEIEQIAADPATFMGVIDGNGKTLKNFTFSSDKQYAAPIGHLTASGEIKNLTMQGKMTYAYTSSSAYNGGIVGKCYGKVTNCVNASEMSTTKGYMGGVAGYAYTGAVFTNCVNRGSLNSTAASSYLGGIVSYAQEGCRFVKCSNEGTLYTTGSSGYVGGITAYSYECVYDSCFNAADIDCPKSNNVAGIVAYVYGTKNAASPYNFNGCYNTGNITGKALVGGLTAYSNSTAGAAIVQMQNCYNRGNITAASVSTSSNSPAAAGIMAHYHAGSTYTNCNNYGIITVDSAAYGAGGIAGTSSGTATAAYPIFFENCHNYGKINGKGMRAYWIGGLVGHVNTYTNLIDCGNHADVYGSFSVGGVAGVLYNQYAEISDCYNTANVTAYSRYVGGIVGSQGAVSANTRLSTISGCWNSGNISTVSTKVGLLGNAVTYNASHNDSHGIGGIAGQTPCLVENCANFGTVNGGTMIAGIVGEPVMNSSAYRTQIKNCYNAAPINAQPTGLVGGITVTSNATYWGTQNTLENCFYATDWNLNNTEGGTGLRLSELCQKEITSSWVLLGENILPVPAAKRNDAGWKANAAAVILRSDNSFASVSRNFHVGMPEGVTWTIEPADAPLTQEGNLMHWTSTDFSGNVNLVAHCGDFTRSWSLTATNATGVNGIIADGDVQSVLYFTTDGLEAPAPTTADGKLYIRVTIYTNGTKTVERILNK